MWISQKVDKPMTVTKIVTNLQKNGIIFKLSRSRLFARKNELLCCLSFGFCKAHFAFKTQVALTCWLEWPLSRGSADNHLTIDFGWLFRYGLKDLLIWMKFLKYINFFNSYSLQSRKTSRPAKLKTDWIKRKFVL